jgi:hypothetical protein
LRLKDSKIQALVAKVQSLEARWWFDHAFFCAYTFCFDGAHFFLDTLVFRWCWEIDCVLCVLERNKMHPFIILIISIWLESLCLMFSYSYL